jgi:hypothetical protein
MQHETVSLQEAEQLTGLPPSLINVLAESGEIPGEWQGERLYVGKAPLLAWCRLFAKILSAVTSKQRVGDIGAGISARNLVWLSQAGLLCGKDRIQL